MDFQQNIYQKQAEIDNNIRIENEKLIKLDLEKSLLYSKIASSERDINELEYYVLQKLPQEFANFEFLFNKELEIHNKIINENKYSSQKKESLIKELKEMVKIYKEAAHVDIEKTKEGNLKLTFFKNCIKSKVFDSCDIIVEIKDGRFKIISLYPDIRDRISQFEEELQTGHNFTLFITKVANEFLNYIKNI